MRLWPGLMSVLFATQVWAEDSLRLGIFGIVESTEPLVVAGREVVVPEGIPVISPLGPGERIRVGDTLAIAATLSGDRLQATRVMEVFPAVGPLANVKQASATIMGTAVHVPPDVGVKAGQWVALSGLWSAETVITSNVRRVDLEGFGQLSGTVEPATSGATWRVGGSEITGAQVPQDGFDDDLWTLSGAPEETGLQVRLMSKGMFGGPVDLVIWQGYASLPVASQTYMIHGSGIFGTATDAQMPAAGALVVRCAVDGRVLKTAPKGLEAAFESLDCARHTPAD